MATFSILGIVRTVIWNNILFGFEIERCRKFESQYDITIGAAIIMCLVVIYAQCAADIPTVFAIYFICVRIGRLHKLLFSCVW